MLAKARQIFRAYELERRFTKSADPRPLSGARALWRQSRRLARRVASPISARSRAASATARRRCWSRCRRRPRRAGPTARPQQHERRATGCSTARSPPMCSATGRGAHAPRPKTRRLRAKISPISRPHASEALFRAHPDRKIVASDPLTRGCKQASKRWRREKAERLGPKLTDGDPGHRQCYRRDPRPCRQRRLFLESARRRHRHDPGAALAGIDFKTLHLRHGLRRRASPIPKPCSTIPRRATAPGSRTISTGNFTARSRRGRRCKCRSTCRRRNCSTKSARRIFSPACATPGVESGSAERLRRRPGHRPRRRRRRG